MLNEAQQKAVETTEGPVRIIAGAGTGKTATLVARIVHLIESEKATARDIVALTFTHKAAHELNERLRAQGLPRIFVTTFHGFAASVLRGAGGDGGPADFSILTQEQQEEILRDLLYSQERDELANVVTDFNRVREAAACGAEWPVLLSSVSIERLGELWQSYRKVLEAKNAVDFTGLLTGVLELWKASPEVLEAWQNRCRYVMVDEYQDVSAIQVEMLKQLAPRNLCVVGDPDQTIYSWRGADPRALLDFAVHFPNTQTITLTQNYRNPACILNPAERLIVHNPDRFPKTLVAMPGGEHGTHSAALPVHLWEARDEWQLHEMVLHLLEQFLGSHDHMARADRLDAGQSGDHHQGGRSFNEIAVLYRTQAEGRFLAAQLSKHGYPFQMSVPTEFWQRKEIGKFLEKLNAMRGVEVRRQKSEDRRSAGEQDDNEILPQNFVPFSAWLRPHLEQFIWNQSIPDNKTGPLLHLLSYAMAYDHFPLPEALSHFLDAAATAQDADHLVASDKIQLLTLHAAKGLEFPIVLILGLEEGMLPHHKLAEDPLQIDEERRLLYVGMTRAREQLHLFTARARDSKSTEPSRFLAEIGHEYLTRGILPEHRALASRRKQVKKAQMSLF